MSASRPNIIFIITDQQRYDTIHALGFPYMDTPNLDRLAAEGVSFTHCHVTAPLCVPSRASLFTGLYPHTTGVLTNVDQWQHSWVERLADSGYHCVNIGKMHAMPYDGRLGFHERYVVENTDTFRVRHLHFRRVAQGHRDPRSGQAAARSLPSVARLSGAPGSLRVDATGGNAFGHVYR